MYPGTGTRVFGTSLELLLFCAVQWCLDTARAAIKNTIDVHFHSQNIYLHNPFEVALSLLRQEWGPLFMVSLQSPRVEAAVRALLPILEQANHTWDQHRHLIRDASDVRVRLKELIAKLKSAFEAKDIPGRRAAAQRYHWPRFVYFLFQHWGL